MAQKKHTTDLMELLLQCVAKPDPMLSMLEWLCAQLMEAEVNQQLRAGKSERTNGRCGYRSGYRPRRLDTRMGTMYLMVPKVRQGGYIPFFVTERKRSEAALIQVVQEAFVQGVSTRKMEKLAKRLGIENLSRSQVSEMTKGLNEQVNEFRQRSLSGSVYPVLWVDALYEKVRIDGRIVSVAVLVVCGVDQTGHRDIIAVEPMPEESEDSYTILFRALKERGLVTPRLVISDAHTGLTAAIRKSFPGASWQRCKVHFMRNILAHVPQKEKKSFAAILKEIWLAPSEKLARKRAVDLAVDVIARAQPDFGQKAAHFRDGEFLPRRKRDKVLDREPLEAHGLLKGVGNAAAGALRDGKPRDVLAVQKDLALRRREDARDDLGERRFPAPVGSRDRDERLVHGKRDVVQDLFVGVAVGGDKTDMP